MQSAELVKRIWNFCHTLRDDGVGYGDYLEQLSFLLFLKLGDEYARPPYNRNLRIPPSCQWETLLKKRGEILATHYNGLLRTLARQGGMLGAIFVDAQNKIQDPAKLARLIRLLDAERWVSLDIDVKGELYEALLQKNAEDTKSGAGQYFTPRALIDAIVACVQPERMKTIADPACGTGGFFLGAHRWLTRDGARLNARERDFLDFHTFYGNEIVGSTRRLCLMNMFLHNIGDMVKVPQIDCADALTKRPSRSFDYVLANPPFGKKSSMVSNVSEERGAESLTYRRKDFWFSTANKQLNFLQHAVSIVKPGGQVAIVVPDNVLFEGGAGEKIRRALFDECDVHTLLRLPSGIFYAQGVKANVLFLEKRAGKVRKSTGLWIYDLRTNNRFTLKNRPLSRIDLDDFVASYKGDDIAGRKASERFRHFTREELLDRPKANLDIFWLKDQSEPSDVMGMPAGELARQIIDHLENAVRSMKTVVAALPKQRKTTLKRSR